MSKSSIIYQDTGAGTSATKRVLLEETYLGVIQVMTTMTSVATITWTIQGRTIPGAAWVTIDTIDESDLPATTLGVSHTASKEINMMHEIQIIVAVGNGATTHSTYLQEF